MTDAGRDELIAARAEKERLLTTAKTLTNAIARLMEDRVRHMTALRQIARMTETGIIAKGGGDVYRIARMTETGIIAKGGGDVYRIAREALDTEADMSWWPEGGTGA